MKSITLASGRRVYVDVFSTFENAAYNVTSLERQALATGDRSYRAKWILMGEGGEWLTCRATDAIRLMQAGYERVRANGKKH